MTPELRRQLERLAKMRSPSVSTILSRHGYVVEAAVLRAIETEVSALPPALLTERELDTVLAALRYWQQRVKPESVPFDFQDHFASHEPLKSWELDSLCDRLNG